jgi:hypothetical protein
VPQDELVDALFAEIDKSLDRGTVHVDDARAAEGAEWLRRIEEENADELTPERIAAIEKAAAASRARSRLLSTHARCVLAWRAPHSPVATRGGSETAFLRSSGE